MAQHPGPDSHSQSPDESRGAVRTLPALFLALFHHVHSAPACRRPLAHLKKKGLEHAPQLGLGVLPVSWRALRYGYLSSVEVRQGSAGAQTGRSSITTSAYLL